MPTAQQHIDAKRRSKALVRELTCQCEWWGHHLCASKRQCETHATDEEQYAQLVLQRWNQLQLRLF